MAPNPCLRLSLLFVLLGLVTSESLLSPDTDPPICPARPSTGPGVAPGQLSPGDNLEAILVVDDWVRMSCQPTGADHLAPGQWVVDSVINANVYDYGEVLRRQTLVLPSPRAVQSLTVDQLGERVGSYAIVLDPQRRSNPTEHIFTAEFPFDDVVDPIFRGSTPRPPPTPTFWLPPESITNPIFVAPMAADVAKEVVIKAYRLWGVLEPGYDGVCTVHSVVIDNRTLVRYKALFLLYGRGNAIRDHKSKWSRPPVCQEPAKKVATGGGWRAAARAKLAFRPPHPPRPSR
ncbi:MAG: hypothetical protein M1826_005561 [Phylliscum demangeonii]|nr:MAG: hypothetical protein M1826_005561 [Phylliscum demangeonii]